MAAFVERLEGMTATGGDQELEALNMWAVASELAKSLGVNASNEQISNAVKALNEGAPKTPAEYGLTDQEADVLTVLSDMTREGGEITSVRFYLAAKAVGAADNFHLKEAERIVGELSRKGLVDPASRRVTDDGMEAATTHKEDVRHWLISNVESARTRLEAQFENVREWKDPNGNTVVRLPSEGVADYLEAINTLDQAKEAIQNSSALMLSEGFMASGSLGADVIEKIRDDMNLVGAKVIEERTRKKENDKELTNSNVSSISHGRGRSI